MNSGSQLFQNGFKPPSSDSCMSVYDRMYNDERLFWLGYGALYITEMRRVKGAGGTELRVKSKGLAEGWYSLCKKYNLLAGENTRLHAHNGIYSFSCRVTSLYTLLTRIGRLPDNQMDLKIRERLEKLIYTKNTPLNKNRIKILKALRSGRLTTNVLARLICFSPGNKFKAHLECLQRNGLMTRRKSGSQNITNELTVAGRMFIEEFIAKIEQQPANSLYDQCLTDKQLAADILMVTSELEMGGILQRQPYLQMKSKDYVEFVRKVSEKWGWTRYPKVVEINRENWGTTYLVGLNSKALNEIYSLAGPCADEQKDAHYKHSFNLRQSGQHGKVGETEERILRLIENNIHTAKEIALSLNIGIQNIQRTLTRLVMADQLKRVRRERGYYYVKC